TTYRAVEDELIRKLNQNQAPDFDFARYRASAKPQKVAQVNEYLDGHLRDHAELRRKREALAKLGAVVPVALDLGSMRLGRAQRMADPAERKAELERAEKTFVAVRG